MHFEYLQFILFAFDADKSPEKTNVIRFFRESFNPLIKAQTEQKVQELDTWKVVIEKAVKDEAKAGL